MSPRDRIGLGLAALGRPAYITSNRERDLGSNRSVRRMQDRTFAVLDAAYATGVRYFDCARSYGLAEKFLARWLSERGRESEDVTVASKWGYRYVGHWRRDATVQEVKDHSVHAFRTQLAQSREELGDSLDIYQIHSVTPDSPALGDGELLRELCALRNSGTRVGLTTSGPRQAEVIRRAVRIRFDGEPLFTVIESTWNLLEQSAGPALAAATDYGVDIVLKEVLANGRLAPGTHDTSSAVRQARALAADERLELDQTVLAAALHDTWATHVLSGAVTRDQIVSNVEASSVRLSEMTVARLLAHPESADYYWDLRSHRPWE